MSVPLRAAAAARVAAARLGRASTTGGANNRRRGERGRERNDTLALLAFRPMKHILTVVEHERVRKGKSALSPLLRGILNGPLADQ